MRRDWECIRAIFLALEEKGDTIGDIRAAQVSGFDGETVSYNMRLLIQAALIEGIVHNSPERRLAVLLLQ